MTTQTCKTIKSLNELWDLIINNASGDAACAICVWRILLEHGEVLFSSVFVQPGRLQPAFLNEGKDSPIITYLHRSWLPSRCYVTAPEKAVRAGEVSNLLQSIWYVYVPWIFCSQCPGFEIWDVILRFSWMLELPYMLLFFGGFW